MSDSFTGLDKACYDDRSAVRRALVSEVAADDTYAEIIRLSSSEEVKEVMEEIQADEQNHIGRLLGLLTKLEGGDVSEFAKQVTAGIEGRELA